MDLDQIIWWIYYYGLVQVDQKLEFPRNRLMLDETIGEGEFGRVPFDVLYFIYKHLTFDILAGYDLC